MRMAKKKSLLREIMLQFWYKVTTASNVIIVRYKIYIKKKNTEKFSRNCENSVAIVIYKNYKKVAIARNVIIIRYKIKR